MKIRTDQQATEAKRKLLTHLGCDSEMGQLLDHLVDYYRARLAAERETWHQVTTRLYYRLRDSESLGEVQDWGEF